MYKNFSLTESEKEQILNMHKNHGYKKPLNENKELSEMDDEEYFTRHGEDNIGWTGSSNKLYGPELPDFDFDDETYDDFDSLNTTYPNFHRHYTGSGNVEHAKSMFDVYKQKYGPLHIKKRRRVQTEQNNKFITKYGNQGYPLTKKALEGYGQKLAGMLKGKTIQLPIMNANGLIQLTVLGYNGREHRFDDTENIANIKSCNFIFNVKVADSSNPNIRRGQTGIFYMNVTFNNLKFVGISEMSLSVSGADGLDFKYATPKLINQLFGGDLSKLNLQPIGGQQPKVYN